MPPNRQAELERLRVACQVNSVEAVPKAQEVTTRCSYYICPILQFLNFSEQHQRSAVCKHEAILCRRAVSSTKYQAYANVLRADMLHQMCLRLTRRPNSDAWIRR